MKRSIPVEVVFAPKWWHERCAISFEKPFYIDPVERIHNDMLMRKELYSRFGIGESNPQPRPVIGSMHVAGGFVLPALFGVQVHFFPDQAPTPETANLTREEILRLEIPDIGSTYPMNMLLRQAQELKTNYGYVIGDFDTDGLLNTALCLRGQQLYIDFFEDPELIHHLFGVLTNTYIKVASLMRKLTGSCSIATNRSIIHQDPRLYLHSNCSVCMVSPKLYTEILLPYEHLLAAALQPYGIHHCGGNLEKYAQAYATLPLSFLDIGWGSDIAACVKVFPNAFLNLRLSPVRLMNCKSQEVVADVDRLLREAGGGKLGICCINMDASTPDENVAALLTAAWN